MQELSANKKIRIIKLYLDGFSYDEIAKKVGVSKGTVSNVIAALKAGQFPEVSTVPEEIEQLRDLATTIRRGGISPIQANIGLSILERLTGLGVEPAEVERCHTLLQALSSPDTDVKAMAKSILAIEEVKGETGLTLEELEAKVVSLREETQRQEPLVIEIKNREKQVAELRDTEGKLRRSIEDLSARNNSLVGNIKSLDITEEKLVGRVTELEERAYAADKQLSEARRDLKSLSKIGLSVESLCEFTVKLKEVSAHHGIKPEDLYRRLLKELKQLDKGLAMEYLVREKEAQLTKLRNEIAKEQAEKEGLHNYLNQLISEKTSLEARLAHYRKQLAQDIEALSSASEKTIREINDSLKTGIDNNIREISKLSKEALRVGKEIGSLEANIESLNWIKPLLSMVGGDNGLADYQVRVVALTVLRSMSSWLHENHGQDWNLALLRSSIGNSVSELEKWKPSTT